MAIKLPPPLHPSTYWVLFKTEKDAVEWAKGYGSSCSYEVFEVCGIVGHPPEETFFTVVHDHDDPPCC